MEARETHDGIEWFIDGIQGAAMTPDAMNGIVKKLQNSLRNVHKMQGQYNKKPNLCVLNCHFRVKIDESLYQLESDALGRMAGRPRTGFRSWIKVAPRPVAAPADEPASEAGPGAVMPAPKAVALAMAVDMANLVAGLDVARTMKEVEGMVVKAMFMLETAQCYLKRLDPSSGAGAGAVAAGVAGSSSMIMPLAASAGSGDQAAGPPGAGQHRMMPASSPDLPHQHAD